MIEDELRATFARHEDQVPPAAVVAAAIEEGYRRRRRRGRARSAAAALAVAATVAVPAAVVSRSTPPARSATEAPAAPVPAGKALNLLLLGIDAGTPPRSDTIIVVHVPASHDRAYLISIERDTALRLPNRQNVKANNAYQLGGLQLAEQAFAPMVGLASFNAGAVVTFDGLGRLVDAVGGVDMCVDKRTVSVHIGHTRDGRFATPYRMSGGVVVAKVPGVTPEVYQVGCHHFAGWQAVDYVRQRMLILGAPDGNAARDGHARDLIQALVKQVSGDPRRVSQLLRVAGQVLTLDTGGLSLVDWLHLLQGVGDVRGLEYDPTHATELRQALAAEDLDGYLATHP